MSEEAAEYRTLHEALPRLESRLEEIARALEAIQQLQTTQLRMLARVAHEATAVRHKGE